MDWQFNSDCTHSFVRNSARSIIIVNKKIAMIHSLKYDYYKFPGGGIEKNETPITAMIRETREDNYYFLCDVEEDMVPQSLDNYEADEAYTMEFVEPEIVIMKNRNVIASPYDPNMFEREACVIEMLLAEGLFSI